MSVGALAPEAAPASSAPSSKAAGQRRLPLAVKLAIALIGLVTLVLLINGGVNLWLNYGEAKRAAVQVQGEKAQAAAERVNDFVSEIENQIGWTTRAEWRRVPPEQQRYDFIRLLRQAPAITEVSYLDSAGKEQLKVSRLEPDQVGSAKDFAAEPRFRQAVAEKVWFGPVYFRRGSEPYMTVAVAHAGRNPGVTTAEVNLKLVWDVITAIKVGEKGYAFVTTAAGRLIAHPDLSLVLRDTDLSKLPQVARTLAASSGLAPANSTAEITDDLAGNPVLTAHARIGRVGWLVFVQSPVSEALAPVYTALWQSLMLLGLGLLLATLAGSLLARRMVVPIRRLQEGAERLGSGDLSQRITIRTGDEIETLADRFNLMAGRIQDSYETLEAKVDERTRELGESLQQQTATADVLKVISRSAFDLQTVLDTLVASASTLCAAEKGVIFLRDGDYYRLVANYGFSEEFEEFAKVNPFPVAGDSTTARAAAMGAPFQVVDVLANPNRSELAISYQEFGGFRTNLGVPLLREGEPIGVLTVTRQVVSAFTERQIGLVQAFADQAVIAIANARLFEEVQARTAELSESLQQQTATADVLKVISRSAFDLQTVLDTLVTSAARLCDAESAFLFQRDGDLCSLVANHGFSAEYVQFMRENPIPAGRETLVGRTALLGTIVHLPDVLADPEYAWRESQRIGGFRTMLGVPLLREGLPIGVLALTRPDVRPFTDKQIDLVATFADQAVIAIENARLFEEVQARTRELSQSLEYQTATSDVLNVISRSPDKLQPVLDAIAAIAARICQAKIADIVLTEGEKMQVAASVGHGARPPGLLPLDRTTVMGRSIVDVAPVHVHDLLEAGDEFPSGKALAVTFGHRTILGVPLIRGDRAIGTILLRRDTVEPFTEKQVALLKTFADQAVIAINNVGLFEEVQARTRELSQSLDDLRKAQDRLVQSEKLASLGQLTAGIAHEIKNPLNFVNNFSSLSADLIDELREVLEPAALDDKTRREVVELTDMLKGNLEKVVSHGKRADSIVKNMLLHSREGSGEHRPVDVNALVEESMNLAYHGARAEKPGFNVTLAKELDPAAGEVDLYPQEITRVLLNLIGNGFYAATKRKAEMDGAFEPTMTAATRNLGDRVEIRIRDNGTGIPDDVKAKMFNPFFTTKPAGEGTGLGLSLSHDIVVKQHGGTIEVATESGAFTEFTIVLPRNGAAAARTSGPGGASSR